MFNSTADRDTVLRAAKHLKGWTAFNRVRITHFLTKDELVKDKAIREQCNKLNEDAEATDQGKKPFIVINGTIISVQAGGKFSR